MTREFYLFDCKKLRTWNVNLDTSCPECEEVIRVIDFATYEKVCAELAESKALHTRRDEYAKVLTEERDAMFARLKECQAQFMAKNDHLNSVMTENSLLFGRAVATNRIIKAVKRAIDSGYFYFQLRPPDAPGAKQTFEQFGEARKLLKEMDRLE